MTETERRAAPLEGVVVLDLTRILAGPWATQTLGDLGATVIKVERPQGGDDTRAWGPPFIADQQNRTGDAAYFLCANRNKQSVTIDFATPKGAALVRALAQDADIFVENFKVGGLSKYGLDYATLREINPRLIYCSISGFGQTGPYAPRPGYDYMIQAVGGLMSVTGQPNGEPGAEPMKAGVAVADLFTGLSAVNAILAALLSARATGLGQHIDMALFDGQLSMLANQAANYFVSGRSPERLGNAHPNLAPYQVFPTRDGAFVIAVGNDSQFRALCAAVGAAARADDPRFLTNALRVENRTALSEELSALFRGQTTAFWIAALEAAKVPCGPINTVEQALNHPQAAARGLVVEQRRAAGEPPIRTVASPIRLSDTPPVYVRPPPRLGEHTDSILGERLGLDAADRAALRDEGVI